MDRVAFTFELLHTLAHLWTHYHSMTRTETFEQFIEEQSRDADMVNPMLRAYYAMQEALWSENII